MVHHSIHNTNTSLLHKVLSTATFLLGLVFYGGEYRGLQLPVPVAVLGTKSLVMPTSRNLAAKKRKNSKKNRKSHQHGHGRGDVLAISVPGPGPDPQQTNNGNSCVAIPQNELPSGSWATTNEQCAQCSTGYAYWPCQVTPSLCRCSDAPIPVPTNSELDKCILLTYYQTYY